jgi:hypothetical protein
MDTEDYIEFENLRKFINIQDPNLLNTYLREVFKDLSDRAESNKKKGISKITFLEYIKMPVLLAEKLFIAFDEDSDGFLNSKEFVDNLIRLYLGDFKETIGIIFKILDFDKDMIINKGDVRLLLSYLPLKSDKEKLEYKFQMDSLEEIDEILQSTFGPKDQLKEDEFIYIVENKKSDVYLQLLCFFYQKKPFNEQNVNMLKVYRRKQTTESEVSVGIPSPEQKRIRSPNRKSYLSPVEHVLKLSLCGEDDSNLKKKKTAAIDKKIDKKPSIEVDLTPEVSGMKGMIRMANQKVAPNKKSEDINQIIKNSKNYFNSPSTFLNKRGKTSNNNIAEFSIESNLIKMDSLNLDDNNSNEERENNKTHNPDSEIIYQDWIYKLSESLKIKKYWLVVSGKDIYYYKNDKKEEMLGMHNLSGCFVKENGEKKINEEKMFCFCIQFSSKARNYYCYRKETANAWINTLKEAIGYKSFFDFYEMLNDIGEGKFGIVKLGMHKNSKEKVAIKIIKKESMNATDIELVKSEIDIMKLCRHPNIVNLLDHFENADYIFIVMEHLTGGDLEDYLNKINFRVIENRAAHLMFQLGSGIRYLHEFGILHRDLKPENIMLSENSEKGIIKIMDFGLSKIMGPGEKVADGFGTLSFVAPEVLIRQPYNKQIDIWSLGVILYYMLSSTLPFDDEDDNEEIIAKMTVFTEVQFPGEKWSNRSEEVIDLIRECLIKDPEKRIKIEDFLQHPWIKHHIK